MMQTFKSKMKMMMDRLIAATLHILVLLQTMLGISTLKSQIQVFLTSMPPPLGTTTNNKPFKSQINMMKPTVKTILRTWGRQITKQCSKTKTKTKINLMPTIEMKTKMKITMMTMALINLSPKMSQANQVF